MGEGEKKVTVMILKVDLECDCCFKRVKKLLCRFPEIRDRVFDEQSNTVMIKVICCDPEKIRYKLCHKGRGSIKSIEIKQPQEPKSVESPAADPPKQKEATPQPPPPAKPESPKKPPPAKSPDPVQNPPEPNEPNPKPVEPAPLFGSEPIPTCCEQCYGGRGAGPCNYGYGPPSIYYENGPIGYNGYGPNRVCHPGRCAEFFSEENPAGCSVM